MRKIRIILWIANLVLLQVCSDCMAKDLPVNDTTLRTTHPKILMEDVAPFLSEMLMVGFEGTSVHDPGVRRMIDFIKRGLVSNVILFKHNIESPQQLKTLTNALHDAAGPVKKIFIAIDQEGGRVQRLDTTNGFNTYLSHEKVAATMTPDQAFNYYSSELLGIKDTRINLVLGPVVDLRSPSTNPDKLNPVIGKIERAFGSDPVTVTAYARAFIHAFRHAGIVTSLKHFPGHGLAEGDSHQGFVDITNTHTDLEHAPFYALIKSGDADMIMSSHLTHRNFDKTYPISLSPHYMKTFLRNRGFEGVIISDDLFMGAIRRNFSFDKALILAIQASNDMIILSINAAAMKSVVDKNLKEEQKKLSQVDFVEESYKAVIDALERNDISFEDLQNASSRVTYLKETRLH